MLWLFGPVQNHSAPTHFERTQSHGSIRIPYPPGYTPLLDRAHPGLKGYKTLIQFPSILNLATDDINSTEIACSICVPNSTLPCAGHFVCIRSAQLASVIAFTVLPELNTALHCKLFVQLHVYSTNFRYSPLACSGPLLLVRRAVHLADMYNRLMEDLAVLFATLLLLLTSATGRIGVLPNSSASGQGALAQVFNL